MEQCPDDNILCCRGEIKMLKYNNSQNEKLIVASRITLFLLSSNRESPNKSKSFLTLSGIDSKLAQTDFTLFIRSTRWCEK